MPQATPAQSRAVVQSLVSLAITLLIMATLLFWPAGTLAWERGQAFLVAFVVAILLSLLILWRVNPEIFAARSRVQPGTKAGDYIFLVLILAGFMAILPVAALDFRNGWAQLPDGLVGFGYILFVVSFAGQVWPQAVNRHFEPGVRIQEDRGQTVIDTGPYAIVRHPGYISGSLLAVSTALVLGSLWALLPALVVVGALVPRTLFEERTLRDGLPGYTAYAERVRWRWIPGVW